MAAGLFEVDKAEGLRPTGRATADTAEGLRPTGRVDTAEGLRPTGRVDTVEGFRDTGRPAVDKAEGLRATVRTLADTAEGLRVTGLSRLVPDGGGFPEGPAGVRRVGLGVEAVEDCGDDAVWASTTSGLAAVL